MISAIIIFLIIGFAFYWYGYRPLKIKQRCSAEAKSHQNTTLEFKNVPRQEFENIYYNSCLVRFGLK